MPPAHAVRDHRAAVQSNEVYPTPCITAPSINIASASDKRYSLDREKPMSYLDADPTKPTQELLSDIRSATQQPHFPGLPLLPFANLLVKVSTEGSEAIEGLKAHITDLNAKNAKLQWWVVALAIAALLSTLIQTIFSVAAYVTPPGGSQSVQASTAQPEPSVVSPKTLNLTAPAATSPLLASSSAHPK